MIVDCWVAVGRSLLSGPSGSHDGQAVDSPQALIAMRCGDEVQVPLWSCQHTCAKRDIPGTEGGRPTGGVRPCDKTTRGDTTTKKRGEVRDLAADVAPERAADTTPHGGAVHSGRGIRRRPAPKGSVGTRADT